MEELDRSTMRCGDDDHEEDKVVLKKGPWSPQEDQKLLSYIHQHGYGSWASLPSKAGLKRCGKSCRLRWTNYLRPDIRRGKFNLQEQDTIVQLHALLGNRWSAIAAHLPKRTGNEIKNYWNTHLKKKLIRMGIDPMTHKPKNHPLGCSQPKDFANLCHMAQWESARLEAESRLVCRQSATPTPPPPPCFDVLKAWDGTLNSFFAASNGSCSSLQSPTSTLSFSNNLAQTTAAIPTAFGSIGGDLGGHDQVRGIMDISVESQDEDNVIVDPIIELLGFPSFIADVAPPPSPPPPPPPCDVVAGGWWGSVVEEDDEVVVNYWGSTLSDVAFSNRRL